MANEKNAYLELEGSTGLLFQYSKVELEGYTKHVYEDKVSYRKYYQQGVFGNLVGFQSREKEINKKSVTTLSIIMDNPELGKTFFITLPFITSRGSVSDYAASAISYLPNLEKGVPYRVYPYAIDREGSEGKNYGVSFNYARLEDEAVDKDNLIDKLSWERRKAKEDGTYEVIPGDIPAVEFVEKMGKITAVTDKRDVYLWKVLGDNRIEYSSGSTMKKFNSKEEGIKKAEYAEAKQEQESKPANKASKSSAAKTAPAQTAVEDEEDDDLPF